MKLLLLSTVLLAQSAAAVTVRGPMFYPKVSRQAAMALKTALAGRPASERGRSALADKIANANLDSQADLDWFGPVLEALETFDGVPAERLYEVLGRASMVAYYRGLDLAAKSPESLELYLERYGDILSAKQELEIRRAEKRIGTMGEDIANALQPLRQAPETLGGEGGALPRLGAAREAGERTGGAPAVARAVPTPSDATDSKLVKAGKYIGAVIIMLSMSVFMGYGWMSAGPAALLGISAAYAVFFVLAGESLTKRGQPINGGLLYTTGVAMVPLITYAVQSLSGWWQGGFSPGSYQDFFHYIKGGWVPMELATIAAAALAARRIKFAFLAMPAAIAAWFLSMDVAHFIKPHSGSLESAAYLSMMIGVGIGTVARLIETRSKVNYAFWLYLAALASAWGGLTTLAVSEWNDAGRFLYMLANLGFIGIGARLNRDTFMTFGGIGAIGYLAYLASKFANDAISFSVVGVFVGVTVITAFTYHKKLFALARRFFGGQQAD